jgi:hypothetical protein
LLDRSLHWPQWAGFALLGLAAVITLFGRHGQRPLNAALLGCSASAVALFGLRGAVHRWIPGVTAVVAFVLCALFGLVAEGWAAAVVVGLLLAGASSLVAHALHFFWLPVAVMFFGLGLFAGMVNHKRLSLWLPPIFSAIFIAWGCAISWAPNWRGAALWQLNYLDWVLGFAGIAAVVLLALSLGREHLQKLRLAARTEHMEDEELKAALAEKQASYQRAIDKAEEPPEDSSEH